MDKFQSAIKDFIKSKVKTLSDLDSAKRRICRKYNITTPSNINLLKAYHKLLKNKRIKQSKNLEYLLVKRRVRSLSGIVNVSVLTKPYDCPGKCIFCPSQKGVPKSYLKKEPAVQRAILTCFDPKEQIKARLEGLTMTGHPTDKIELRIIGGTWSYYPKSYQTWFVTNCFAVCNNSKKTSSLEYEQKRNEKARHRIIGLTIETRPDYIDLKEIKRLRYLGVTRVELGAQSIYDDVLRLNKRGHTIKETIKATKLLKDAGFKVSYQIMPNLPGSSFKRDVEMFKELFSNPDFQPDLLKIYPLGLVKESVLYNWYKKNKYKPYSKQKLIKLLKEIKKHIPYYVRIERVIRDIPSADIVAGGVKMSNLREIVQKEVDCKCIRCREVKENYDAKEKLYLFGQEYEASGGKEIFLSFENKERTKLYALLRLRAIYEDGICRHAIVREIHTYGQMAQIQKTYRVRDSIRFAQHKGLGKKLMAEAENISRGFGAKKIAVIAGIGVRPYYRKLGYKLENTYMVKKL
jgi:elongator complex protein 3 (tRNA carboxymethyluridine synthase)